MTSGFRIYFVIFFRFFFSLPKPFFYSVDAVCSLRLWLCGPTITLHPEVRVCVCTYLCVVYVVLCVDVREEKVKKNTRDTIFTEKTQRRKAKSKKKIGFGEEEEEDQ